MLPRHHSKSQEDRDRPHADLVREADEEERTGEAVPRLKEATVGCQISELSALFMFGVNHQPQLLTLGGHAELFKRHSFTLMEGERDQRNPGRTPTSRHGSSRPCGEDAARSTMHGRGRTSCATGSSGCR